ncbi:hypothetical protein [Streptomyces sp. M41(2017)]|uniref:hypothetical protein n=1 Tax=Streptomyces sp. M41(2017) TaxID=1955065 RepID=UPI0015C420B1|nr:hypothetical protein [Streptomyces sp. M41(2017)]
MTGWELTRLPVRDGPALFRLFQGEAFFLVRTERACPAGALLVMPVVVRQGRGQNA